MSQSDFMDDPPEWQTLLSEARKFPSFNLFAIPELEEVFLVSWDFSLWRWDPVDGCFMPAQKLEAT